MANNNKAESYWERRSIELEEKWNTRSRETVEKELAAYYSQALQHIQKDIEALYGTFSKDNKVSMTEARKILQGDEYRVWRMDIKDYIRELEKLAAAGAVSKSNELLRELNTLAMRSRITRLDKLYAETLAELGRLAGKTEAGMDKFLTDAYKDGYYRNLYEIGKKAGLKSMPSKVDSSKVENVLRTPWSGKNYSQRIWGNDAKLGERIKETITQGIHRGSSIGQLSRQLADRMGVGFHDAERLVRTELNYVQNRAALEGIKDAGMGFYRFVATLDNRTTQKCISHDGHVFPVEEASPGDNMPPLHARCRSTICASLGEEGSCGGRRIARSKDDKNIRVPEEMRYNDWKAVYIDKSKSWKDWAAEVGHKGREMFATATDYTSQGAGGGGIIKTGIVSASQQEGIRLEKSMERRKANAGEFAELEIPLQKRAVERVCRKYDVDISGLIIKIQRGEDCLRSYVAGATDYNHIGRIDILPIAFKDEEQLVRTVLHERVHVKQLLKYGKSYVQENITYMERVAERCEELFWRMKRRGRQT